MAWIVAGGSRSTRRNGKSGVPLVTRAATSAEMPLAWAATVPATLGGTTPHLVLGATLHGSNVVRWASSSATRAMKGLS